MTFSLSDLRLIGEAILVAICLLLYALYQSDEAELATIKAEGKVAKERADEINALHEKTFKETQDAWVIAIPTIRSNAVAEYRRRHVGVCNSSQVPVPGNAQGAQGTDDRKQEQLACSTEFIRDCAEDAGKVGAWITWATKNQLPVE